MSLSQILVVTMLFKLQSPRLWAVHCDIHLYYPLAITMTAWQSNRIEQIQPRKLLHRLEEVRHSFFRGTYYS
jgi:hypothetical protein